jgi:hypothetical protein
LVVASVDNTATYDIGEVLRDTLTALSKHQRETELGSTLRIVCEGTFSDSEPYLNGDPSLVDKIAKIGASLEISLLHKAVGVDTENRRPPENGNGEGRVHVPRTTAALTFSGGGFDPTHITKALGLQPTAMARVGESVTRRAKARRDYWRFALDTRSQDFNTSLDALLTLVTARTAEIRRIRTQTRADLTVDLEGNYVELVPRVLVTPNQFRLVAEIGAGLGLELTHRKSLDTQP